MSTVEKSIELDVPVREAYNQWTQFEQFPEFMEDVKHIRQLADDRLLWQVEVGEAERSFEAQITEQVPDQRIAWQAQGETVHAGVVTFHKLDDEHSKVMLQMDVEPNDWVEKAGDALGVYSAAVARDLDNFKQLMETRDHASGAWRGTIDEDGVKKPISN